MSGLSQGHRFGRIGQWDEVGHIAKIVHLGDAPIPPDHPDERCGAPRLRQPPLSADDARFLLDDAPSVICCETVEWPG
jgi:hypothetical protein